MENGINQLRLFKRRGKLWLVIEPEQGKMARVDLTVAGFSTMKSPEQLARLPESELLSELGLSDLIKI